MRLGHDGQIGAARIGVKIGGRGRAALPGFLAAVKLGHLIESDPLLLRAVEVGVLPDLKLTRRPDEGAGDRVRASLVGDMERAGIPVPGVSAVLVGFRPPEVGEDVGI